MTNVHITIFLKGFLNLRKITGGMCLILLTLGCSPAIHPELTVSQNPSGAFLKLSALAPEFGTRYRISSWMNAINTKTGETVKRQLPSLVGTTFPEIMRQTRSEMIPDGCSISLDVLGRVDDRRSFILYYFKHELAFDTRAGHMYTVVIELVDHHPGEKYNVIVYEKEITSDEEKGKAIVINRGFPLNATELTFDPIMSSPTDFCIDD